MRACLDALWMPKHGSSAEEYEDAFAPSRGGVVEGDRLRFAVADGATDAAFSRLWAGLLVRGYEKGWIEGRNPRTRDGFARLGRIWWRKVGRKPLPWYGEHKRQLGSFAALVGLELAASERGGAGTWRSFAVGDCCLFHTRGDRLLGSFPIEVPEDFGNRPVLLSSNTPRNEAALASAAVAWGDWEEGDTFYLASDALAKWFLADQHFGEEPWRLPLAPGPANGPSPAAGAAEAQEAFGRWVTHLRAEQQLRNDDVTLLRIATAIGPSAHAEGRTSE